MKRWCLALLTALALQGSASPYPDTYSFSSCNGRYKVKSDGRGASLWEGKRKLWWHPSDRLASAVVADQGDLVICEGDGDLLLYDRSGRQLDRVPYRFEFTIDPPRTCWTARGSIYLELSQGDLYEVREHRWCPVENPPSTPISVRNHQKAPVTMKELQEYVRAHTFPVNFRNLTPAQREWLLERARARDPQALTALGLAREPRARPELLKAACSNDELPATAAQQALILLDGPAAAAELVPALNGRPGQALLQLYELVPCPEAVLPLLNHLNGWRSSHAALVAQTRVDLGLDSERWRQWLARKDRTLLANYNEPSAPLWKAQQDDPGLSQSLLKQPRLIGLFQVSSWSRGKVMPLRDRLIRTEGESKDRVLEWSLVDGKPMASLPSQLASDVHFKWNPQQQLLYYASPESCGLLRGRQLLFQEQNRNPTQARPPWFPSDLSDPHFAADGSYVEDRQAGGSLVRYSLPGGQRRTFSASGGMFSPNGRYWVGGNQLLDWELNLMYFGALQFWPHCFSSDSQLLAASQDSNVVLLEAKNLKVLRQFPTPGPAIEEITFDESGRRLAVLARGVAYVYDLHPEPPDLRGDNRLLTECWTGYRLWAGGARRLTEAEYWQRRRRLAQPPLPEPNYLPIAASLGAIALLSLAYIVAARR